MNTRNPPSMVPTRQLHLLTTKLTTGPYVNYIHTISHSELFFYVINLCTKYKLWGKKHATHHFLLNEKHLFKVRAIIAKENR